MSSGQYPELAGLSNPLRQAFEAQRAQGLQGLDQVDDTWIDDVALVKALRMSNYVDLERSHAIWILYELTDDGQQYLDDYFELDNEALLEALTDYLDLDDDESEYLEIIEDKVPYPAPYDIPVPQPAPYVPPMPYPAPQTGSKGPMVGPAGMNARAGSFAPLTPAPAVVPQAPPPGNVEINLKSDAGDQWSEFCREVWDAYELNKATLPLDLKWYDRYRPREEQITGLGFKFLFREFTGVRMLMGYLDRDGDLIDNIDLPASELDKIMATWGGDWNVDDITQFVHKLKGENPETGFSFTSENLYNEVKDHLTGLGWKEVH
jgi:hypothetical protein